MKSLTNSLSQLNSTLSTITIQQPQILSRKGSCPSLDLSKIVAEYCQFLGALKGCRKIAEEETAKVMQEMPMLTELQTRLNNLQKDLQKMPSSSSTQNTSEYEEMTECSMMLRETANKYSDDFRKMLDNIQKVMEQLRTEMRDFKIVLFGRTKVGKSTVREALTQGDGKTIGKGGQSTTVEINTYNWFNLQVSDTPGILSVRDTDKDSQGIGREEKMAAALLSRADIALFMFASDNIEEAEREYLRKIAGQGKDILILLNVKSDISDYRMYRLRHKERELTPEAQAGNLKRIQAVLPKAGENSTIVPVHAQAAYFSRAKGDRDVNAFYEKYQVTQEELYELSRFSSIREFIIRNINIKGKQIRFKTIWNHFIDSIRVLSNGNRAPIECARQTVADLHKRIENGRNKVERIITKHKSAFRNNLLRLARERISTYDYAANCIEYDYSKDSIQRGWQEKLQELKELPPILLKDFHEDVQQVMDEMLNECQFVAQCADDFSAFEAGVDWNRWMKVGSFMAGGLFTILTAGAALNFWNPAGWVMGALAILSTIFGFLIGLFKSKARKIADLNEKLEDSLGQACDNIAQQMEEFCENGSPATAEREATQGPFAVLRSQFQGMLENQNQMLKVCDGFLALNDQLLKKADDYQENVKKRLQAAPKR